MNGRHGLGTALAIAALMALAGAACDDGGSSSSSTSTTDTSTPPADTTAADTTPADTSGGGCDHIAQTGCGQGMNCGFTAEGTSPECVDGGTVAYGDECGGEDRCALGVCLSLNETANLCYRFCEDASVCGDDDCLTLTNAPFKVCQIAGIYTNCDLITQDCEQGKGCYSVANQDDPICLPAGTDKTGDGCSDAAACEPGNICINEVCALVCDATATTEPCTSGTCTEWRGDAGYCRVDTGE